MKTENIETEFLRVFGRKKKIHWATELSNMRKALRSTKTWKEDTQRLGELRQVYKKKLLAPYLEMYKQNYQPEPIVSKDRQYTVVQYPFTAWNDRVKDFSEVLKHVKGSGTIGVSYSYRVRHKAHHKVMHKALPRLHFTRKDQVVSFLRKVEAQRQSEQVERPNTKFVFERSLSLVVKIIPDGQPLLGFGELPHWITHRSEKRNRSVIPLEGYKDDLCNWRCFELSVGKYPHGYCPDRLTSRARKLCKRYHKEVNIDDYREALTLAEYRNVETFLERQIVVYKPERRADGTVEWLLIQQGLPAYKNPIYVGHYNDHTFLIKNIFKLTQRVQCDNCGQYFAKPGNLTRHRCHDGKTIVRCENKEVKAKQTLFERAFNKKYESYPHFIVWDIECILKPKNSSEQNTNLKLTAEHVPVSVSIADSLTGVEKTIVSRTPQKLVQNMIKVLQWKRAIIVDNVVDNLAQKIKMEDVLRFIFELLTGKVFETVRDHESKLELDGYNEGLKIGFEFNGKQHYEFSPFFHKSQDDFQKQRRRDHKKHKICTEKHIDLFVCNDISDIPSIIRDVTQFLKGSEAYVSQKRELNSVDCSTVQELTKKVIERGQSGATLLLDYLTNVPVIGFNSGKYDINALKELIVSEFEEADIAKNGNKYMFMKTKEFNFLDIYNYLAPSYSLGNFLKAYKCEQKKGHFPYEWFDDYSKLDFKGLPTHENWYSSLKNKNISIDEYNECVETFKSKCMATFTDWLKHYNSLDTIPMVEAVRKVRQQYDKLQIDIFKDCVSISGLAMKYLLNNSVREGASLFAPSKEAFDLLQTGLVGGPSIIFKRYAERNRTNIRYQGTKPCKKILGYDANALYLWCLAQEMPCGQEAVSEFPKDVDISKVSNCILEEELFGFVLCDIEVPKNLYDKFSEMSPIFANTEIGDEMLPEHLREYIHKTGRSRAQKVKKLCGVMSQKQILLYTPLLKWYLEKGLVVTKYHTAITYKPVKCFKWFAEWVSNERRKGDLNPDSQIAADTAKLIGNSGYGKLIENLLKQTKTFYTSDDKKIKRCKQSALFGDITRFGETYEIDMKKQEVEINRPYQCGIAVYQLAKLKMLQFYYDFMDKFCDRSDFEYLEMDTDSAYMAISGECLEDIIKPETKDEYERVKNQWFVHDKYSKRTPGLFKLEYEGNRMVSLCSKCYFVDRGDGNEEAKLSCKGVQRNKNKMTFNRYLNTLKDYLSESKNPDFCTNLGFRIDNGHVVTYSLKKLGLSAAYDKRYLLPDGIHTIPIKM